jgi:VacB/RNase II family 3'-5' exoribonuclease
MQVNLRQLRENTMVGRTPMTIPARAALERIARHAMRDRGFEPDYPTPVKLEVARLHEPPVHANGRRDLRALLWASIDNDDSRDLDQLSVAEPLPNGDTAVLVAIADVDALVAKGSAVDDHAALNTTTVYTPAEVFAMLPEQLSTDLTSLALNQDRLAIVVELLVAADGAVRRSDLYPAAVRNRAKLAYGSVGDWLEGRSPAPPPVAAIPGLEDNLRRQDAVAQALEQRRHEHGALSLRTIEVRPVLDGDVLQDLAVDHHNRAGSLIENLMIAANTATVRFLDQARFPSIRRIVRTPKRWDRIVALAAESGDRLPPEPDAPALEAWLVRRRAADAEHFADLSLSVVKLLGRGEYVLERPGEPAAGHFGLALQDYTHATAPNRRFSDLVTQRLVKAALASTAAPYVEDELARLAQHCTEREDAANRVERQVRKAAAAMLLAPRIGEIFDAVVTGASAKGTWVRLRNPPVEGRLEPGGQGLDVGDALRVRLVRTDPERGFIDFSRA